MNKLTERPVNRLFAFGCSFTKWAWTGWPEIIANHLDIPHYNFGLGGSGNTLIVNRLIQAKRRYKINQDDLVIICWTNLLREDRWLDSLQKWKVVGNIFNSSGVHTDKWLQTWANDEHYAIRDLAQVALAVDIIENSKCQYHFLSMTNLIHNIDENNSTLKDSTIKQKLLETYQSDLEKIKTSYYDFFDWNNNHREKTDKDCALIHPLYNDGHPSPLEHYQYLFHLWPELEDQYSTVELAYKNWKSILRESYRSNRPKSKGCLYDILTHEQREHLFKSTLIRASESIEEVI